MNRFLVPLQFAAALGVSISCYLVSMGIGGVQDDVRALEKRAEKAQAANDLLRTELAVLARFDRLQQISDTSLNLAAPDNKQLVQSAVQLAALAPGADDLAVKPERPTDTLLVRYEAPAPRVQTAPVVQRALVAVAAPDRDLSAAPARIGPSLIAAIDSAAALEARRP